MIANALHTGRKKRSFWVVAEVQQLVMQYSSYFLSSKGSLDLGASAA